jgi:hypothetical protein
MKHSHTISSSPPRLLSSSMSSPHRRHFEPEPHQRCAASSPLSKHRITIHRLRHITPSIFPSRGHATVPWSGRLAELYDIFFWKIIPHPKIPANFVNNPLHLPQIKLQSPKFPRRPLVFKIFSKIPLDTFQKF